MRTRRRDTQSLCHETRPTAPHRAAFVAVALFLADTASESEPSIMSDKGGRSVSFWRRLQSRRQRGVCSPSWLRPKASVDGRRHPARAARRAGLTRSQRQCDVPPQLGNLAPPAVLRPTCAVVPGRRQSGSSVSQRAASGTGRRPTAAAGGGGRVPARVTPDREIAYSSAARAVTNVSTIRGGWSRETRLPGQRRPSSSR